MDVLLSWTKAVISKTDAVCSLMSKFFPANLAWSNDYRVFFKVPFVPKFGAIIIEWMKQGQLTLEENSNKRLHNSFNLEDHQHWMDRNNKEQTLRTSTKCWTRNFFSCQMSRLVLSIKRYSFSYVLTFYCYSVTTSDPYARSTCRCNIFCVFPL